MQLMVWIKRSYGLLITTDFTVISYEYPKRRTHLL